MSPQNVKDHRQREEKENMLKHLLVECDGEKHW